MEDNTPKKRGVGRPSIHPRVECECCKKVFMRKNLCSLKCESEMKKRAVEPIDTESRVDKVA